MSHQPEASGSSPRDVLVTDLASALHAFQLFEEGAFPAQRIAEYLNDALRSGGGAAAIATTAHSHAISNALLRLGVDVAAAVRSGQLVLRDAEQLARSLGDVTGLHDARFRDLIAQPVNELLARHASVRLYGEVVDVLCRSGNVAGAIELERAWNALLDGRPAQLLCGYAVGNFAELESGAAFRTVCDLHDCVEPMGGVADTGDHRRVVAELQRAAFALENEASRRRGVEAQRDLLVGAERLANSRAQRAQDTALQAKRRLQLLANAMRRIADARLDLAEILGAIAEEVARPDFAQCCVIHLREDDGRRLRLAAMRDLRAATRAEAGRELRDAPVEIGEGFIGRVAGSGRPERIAAVEDGFDAMRPEALTRLTEHALSAAITVPLHGSGQLLGTLTAWRYEPSPPFTDDDQQLLEQLATRAALAVDNALLYARANRERQRAELANRTKDEFLAMLGHELRNPLAPLLNAVQLMRLRANDAFVKERSIIERQVNQMVRLVDDLLDVSRIKLGKVQLKRTPVEVASVIAAAIETVSPVLEERAHKLVTSVPSSGLQVDADPDRLEQVVANLLTNAAKYTPRGGRIELTARVHDTMVAISVRDDGIGIEPHLLPTIFELFAQAEQPVDRALGGLDLGRAIARSLVELHGGKLYARSDGAGRGSEFTLELPRLRASQASPGAPRNSRAARGRV